ncbi:MAG: DUF29 domain-containing protein [Candidatus Entotheonellia bacterium]
MSTRTALYDQDFYAWTMATASLVRQGRWQEIDWEHLVEELEALGRGERRELGHRLEVLVLHLLKWRVQSEYQSRSWRSTILEQRRRVAELLEDNPSLRSQVPDLLKRAYPHARRSALEETGLYEHAIPQDCPFTWEQVLDEAFWPEASWAR